MSDLVRPQFIRLPEPTRAGVRSSCPHTGFSRTGLYNLCVPCQANQFKPAVPAKLLKQRGNTRGIWLIPYDALMAHLHALPTGVESISPANDTGNGIKAAAKQPNRTAEARQGKADVPCGPSSRAGNSEPGEPATGFNGLSRIKRSARGANSQRRSPDRRSGKSKG